MQDDLPEAQAEAPESTEEATDEPYEAPVPEVEPPQQETPAVIPRPGRSPQAKRQQRLADLANAPDEDIALPDDPDAAFKMLRDQTREIARLKLTNGELSAVAAKATALEERNQRLEGTLLREAREGASLWRSVVGLQDDETGTYVRAAPLFEPVRGSSIFNGAGLVAFQIVGKDGRIVASFFETTRLSSKGDEYTVHSSGR